VVPPNVGAVNPVLPGILAWTSKSGLVLLKTLTPLLGWLAVAPHCHVDVLAPVFALPVVMASASQVTMFWVVAFVRI
jgi:hypothetical protein